MLDVWNGAQQPRGGGGSIQLNMQCNFFFKEEEGHKRATPFRAMRIRSPYLKSCKNSSSIGTITCCSLFAILRKKQKPYMLISH